MAMTATPTSANTAAHIPARPRALSTSTAILMPRASTIFSLTMRRVCRAMRMATPSFSSLSSINTTSAASMAASLPMAPMATPTSARESTGASLMPSPTNTSWRPSFFSPSRRSTWVTLSAGSSPACTSSMPSRSATVQAASGASPVNITSFSTPSCFRSFRAWAAPGFRASSMRITPAYWPSTARYTSVPPPSAGVNAACSCSIRRALPTATDFPST